MTMKRGCEAYAIDLLLLPTMLEADVRRPPHTVRFSVKRSGVGDGGYDDLPRMRQYQNEGW